MYMFFSPTDAAWWLGSARSLYTINKSLFDRATNGVNGGARVVPAAVEVDGVNPQ